MVETMTTPAATTGPLLEAKNLSVHFPIHSGLLLRKTGSVFAVNDVSFKVYPGKTLGLVGESGCGKTTVGRAVLKLNEMTSGQVFFQGQDLATVKGEAMLALRREMQLIFQDPFESLNSRQTVSTILRQPFIVHRIGSEREQREKVAELLEIVGLSPSHAERFPHEFSGGQRQRICIARAIALNPKLIVCDEPVSALDVSIQSQVLNLLMDLQKRLGLAYLFIAHNLAVVRLMADQIAVMYLGNFVEYTSADRIYTHPKHPYTRALISAIPSVKVGERKERIVLSGDLPSPINPPSGCTFHTRCPYAKPICSTAVPPLRKVSTETDGADHWAACHFAGEI